jgi:4-hydroxythreonine-4-phosphate dehydrogenase
MKETPAIAITTGEPAGIGPELVAMLAERHRERPFAARLVLVGDRDLLAARAERIGLAPRYVDYSAASFAPPDGASRCGTNRLPFR